MPYFHSDDFEPLENRMTKYNDLTGRSNYCCSGFSGPREEAASRDKFGVHVPLTLDEYYCPDLEPKTLDDRNRDQVVLRNEKKRLGLRNTDAVPGSMKLITVNQAWLWKFDDCFIGTVPAKYHVNTSHRNIAFDVVLGIMQDRATRIGVTLSELVDDLDRPYMAGLPDTVFSIFEKSIASLSEEVKQYLAPINAE
jgi:hypothetical protein